MKLHAQNELYNSFSFWDLKVLTLSWWRPLSYRNQSIDGFYMITTSAMKELKASLGMPGYAWPHWYKITSSICSFNRLYLHAKNQLYASDSFETLKFKNPVIWLADIVFAFNLRSRFVPDMRFQQNHKGHYGAWFKPKKSTHQ